MSNMDADLEMRKRERRNESNRWANGDVGTELQVFCASSCRPRDRSQAANRRSSAASQISQLVCLIFHESVAAMAVVVDAMFLFQLLNVIESSLRMRAGDTVPKRLVGVQQYLL